MASIPAERAARTAVVAESKPEPVTTEASVVEEVFKIWRLYASWVTRKRPSMGVVSPELLLELAKSAQSIPKLTTVDTMVVGIVAVVTLGAYIVVGCIGCVLSKGVCASCVVRVKIRREILTRK